MKTITKCSHIPRLLTALAAVALLAGCVTPGYYYGSGVYSTTYGRYYDPYGDYYGSYYSPYYNPYYGYGVLGYSGGYHGPVYRGGVHFDRDRRYGGQFDHDRDSRDFHRGPSPHWRSTAEHRRDGGREHELRAPVTRLGHPVRAHRSQPAAPNRRVEHRGADRGQRDGHRR